MADHPNAAAVRAAQERFEQSGDPMSAMDMLADDVVWHEIGSEEPIRGKQAVMERFASMPEGADIKVETHDVVGNDEHTIQLVTATATLGDQKLVYRTAEIYHMRDGRSPSAGPSPTTPTGSISSSAGPDGRVRPPGGSTDTEDGRLALIRPLRGSFQPPGARRMAS